MARVALALFVLLTLGCGSAAPEEAPGVDLATASPPCLPAEPPAPAVTLESAELDPPGPNRADEPLRATLSLQRAATFLDATALLWHKRWGCFTCHSNFAYLMARPALGVDSPAYRAVRAAAEEMVNTTWPSEGPRWDPEVVMGAAALGSGDAVTGRVQPVTRAALARMWQLQRSDGQWVWLTQGLPPQESDHHYGVTMAAIAAALAPEGYSETPEAQAGLARAREYLQSFPTETLHQRAMLLWADALLGERLGLLRAEQRADIIAALLRTQNEDGGVALPSLGPWERVDGSAQSTESDGYGTAFVSYVLLKAGLPPSHPMLSRALAWLRSHQRESGRWFTRSASREGPHYISHAGTAFAVLALTTACAPPR